MLGNWSFGDYFKAEAIAWAWKLLTETWGLPKDRLYATVFGGDKSLGLGADDEAAELWTKVTDIDPTHIQKWGMKDNFWQMGSTGPCGPCTEIHVDLTPDRSGGKLVNTGTPRVIEIWNLVFIQFNMDDAGKLTPLPAKHVDTGMGLERVSAIIKHLDELKRGTPVTVSNYGTELFVPIIKHIEQLTGCEYGQTRKHLPDRYDSDDVASPVDVACRVIADHVRTLTFAITDGAAPSNEGRGYVLRRLLRRASRYGRNLGMHEPFIYKLVPTVVKHLGVAFPELASRAELVAETIHAEEKAFVRTLDRGIDLFEQVAERLAKAGDKAFPGDEAFRLYDTYGFPLDLTALLARERGLTVDEALFEKLMEDQRDRARQAAKGTASGTANLDGLDLPTTDDSAKYATLELSATLLGYIADGAYITQGNVPADRDIDLVLDRTCFYAEQGGQVGDHGTIRVGQATFTVSDTHKVNGVSVVHHGQLTGGTMAIGATATLNVDRPRRQDIANNHTATHLLQWALQQTLGDHVKQAGSLVCDDYLRFDFTHTKAMTDDEIARVETLVREQIDAASPVLAAEMPQPKALELGVMALFGEKYGKVVRVLAIGADREQDIPRCFSRELCGGTHVTNTASIMDFAIVREESLQTGVRRITAKTGRGLRALMHQRYATIVDLSRAMKVPADQVTERIAALLEENKKLKKQLKDGAATVDIGGQVDALLASAKSFGSAKLVIGELPAATVDAIRTQIDRLKKKLADVVVFFATQQDGKLMLLSAVSDLRATSSSRPLRLSAAAAAENRTWLRPAARTRRNCPKPSLRSKRSWAKRWRSGYDRTE
jgi:alanyl-tRNA synthetase